MVVARQCSGVSSDVPAPAPPATTAQVRVVIEAGTGQVVGLPQGAGTPAIDCPGTCEAELPVGTTLDLFAVPGAGFGAPTWTGADCGTGPATQCSVIVTGDREVRVAFPPDPVGELYDLTVVFAGTGSGRVDFGPVPATCTDTCTQVDVAGSGDSVFLSATPDPGSAFGGWTGVDFPKGTFAQVDFTDSDRTVTVRFD